LIYFDQLKRDEGYAAVIENTPEEMVCSHQVKRFFKAFSWLCGGAFRKILKRLFIWQVKIERPKKIELTIDLMILDNDEAEERHGVEPTYIRRSKGLDHCRSFGIGRLWMPSFEGAVNIVILAIR
jgi:hypothetical protein